MSTINGPKDFEEVGGLVIVADEDGVQVNYTDFRDGRLWEVNWKVEADGTAVRRAVGYVPKTAIPDGFGERTEDGRTYAGYWRAAA
ncbi:hypothetical protein [Streptosporangium sp. V21-05]|uniref:hypothetical protein n=1 Tax=Streptosporangium sp. V21-05 TaxID=3446115 RepID=UPI003F52CCA4